MLLHEQHERVEEVPEAAVVVPERRAVGREAIDHDALRLERANHVLQLREVPVNLQFLGRVVPDPESVSGDGRFQIESDLPRVAQDLSRGLVQGDHQALLLLADALREVLQTHHTLAHPGDANDQKRPADPEPAADERVEPGGTGRDPGCLERRSALALDVPRRLDAAIDFDALPLDDAHGMPSEAKVVTSRLDDFQRTNRAALERLRAKEDHGVGDELFRRRARLPGLLARHGFEAQHGRQVLALQSFRKDVEGLPGFHAVGGYALVADAVNKDPPCPDLRRFVQQEAVRMLKLLVEDLTRGEDYLQPVSLLELRKVPAEHGRVSDDFVGGYLEQHDQTWLVELGGAAVNELEAQRCLARSDGSLRENDIAAGNATAQDRIEAENAGSDEVPLRHRPLSLLLEA